MVRTSQSLTFCGPHLLRQCLGEKMKYQVKWYSFMVHKHSKQRLFFFPVESCWLRKCISLCLVVVDSGLLGIAVLRKWAHRAQQLKGIRFHESKLWRIKKPNEHGLVWRVEERSHY